MNLPEKMKALVAYSSDSYKLETEWPTPECGDDDIIIKVEGCGICASDLKCQHGAAMYWGDDVQPAWVQAPFIPGHEFIGTVAAYGENVTDYEVGDRITAEQILPCWNCKFCNTGKYWMCQRHIIFGFFTDYCGAMAEYMRLPKGTVVHRVPGKIPLEKVLLVEPYACAKHCVDRADIQAEDVVVISGAGTLGLGMITYAATRNPGKLIVLDMADNRLEKAKEFGADIVMNPGKVDVVKAIMEMTEGYGCDTYIEATGHPSSVVQGLRMIRKLGRYVEFSVFGEPTTVDWSIIGDKKELDVLGSHLGPYCFPYAIEYIGNDNMRTDGLIKSSFPIEEWETAFEYATGKYGDLKVMIKF